MNNTSNDGNDIIELFEVVSVDPVEDVEAAVGSKSKEIVTGDGLGLPGLGDHEQLGQDGHGLQVDGEGPEDLHDAPLVVEQHGQQRGGPHQELHAERVVVTVVCSFEFEVHEVHSGGRAGDEEDLHGCVVDADEVGDQVQVPGDEDEEEQDLALAGDAGTAPGLPYLEEEQDDGQEVGQVAQEPKHVHPHPTVALTRVQKVKIINSLLCLKSIKFLNSIKNIQKHKMH